MSQNGTQQFRIEHSTAYRYSEPVMLSHQQLHLTPRRLDYQTTQAHEAVIKPAPTQQRDIIDAFGNPVTESPSKRRTPAWISSPNPPSRSSKGA